MTCIDSKNPAPKIPLHSTAPLHSMTPLHELVYAVCARVLKPIPIIYLTFEKYDQFTYTQHKSSTQVGVRVNSVLTMNDCIKCYLSLFKNIILQQFGVFKTEILGFLKKLSHFTCPVFVVLLCFRLLQYWFDPPCCARPG